MKLTFPINSNYKLIQELTQNRTRAPSENSLSNHLCRCM